MARSGLLGVNKKINDKCKWHGEEGGYQSWAAWDGISPVHNASFDWPRAR